MEIIYTSKRRHKPDVLGAELAPDMTYTNWTAGASATLSNDSDGNLKIAYNSVSNPYASKLLAVTIGQLYKITISHAADGAALGHTIYIGTALASATYASRQIVSGVVLGESGSTTFYVYASSEWLYVTLYCVTSTSNYALFSDVSVKAVTTLGHAETDVLPDWYGRNDSQWTASNATLASDNSIFAYGGGIGDEAYKCTNSGAVNGQLRHSVPTIAGRTYRAQVYAYPFNTQEASLLVGTSAGGSEYDTATVTDALGSVFTAGSGLSWDFTNTADGWTIGAGTGATHATYYSHTTSGTNDNIQISGLSFSGFNNRWIIIRTRLDTGTPTYDGVFYYKTAAHNFDVAYYADTPTFTITTAEWCIGIYDMWQLVSGGTDWKDNTITGLRYDYTSTSGIVYDIDFIAVGDWNPLQVDFVATGTTTYITLQNGSISNGVGYWYLPRVIQQDSEYTLSVDASQADEEYPSRKTVLESLGGEIETNYNYESEFWTIGVTGINGNDALADWKEFFSSCKGGETFTMDIYDDGNVIECTIDGDPAIRREAAQIYSITFRARRVNA